MAGSGFFELYKPVRNRAARYNLIPSLLALWAYSIHVIDRKPLPRGIARGAPLGVRLGDTLHSFEMPTLVREIILNAREDGKGDRDLSIWQGLADLANEIKRADERLARADGEPGSFLEVMWELHRQSHRQFPMQHGFSLAALVRAYKVFSWPDVNALLVEETGMTMEQLLRLGVALNGNYLSRPDMNATTDFSAFGIPPYVSLRFFDKMAADLPTLRHRLHQQQSHDRQWLLTFNELTRTPLIRIDPAHPERLLCPVPRLLFDRVTNGVFFDIVNNSRFSAGFGPSFQAYIGEVLRAACRDHSFTILEEVPYQQVKAKLKHGADWILSDQSGHVFIECKTKRLAVAAKTLSSPTALDDDLKVFARAVVQHYKNILDAKAGLTSWHNDDLPIHPLVVTLDDLYLFGSAVRDALDAHVRNGVQAAGLPLSVLDDMPWQIASARELELACQVVNARGIDMVFGAKTKDP